MSKFFKDKKTWKGCFTLDIYIYLTQITQKDTFHFQDGRLIESPIESMIPSAKKTSLPTMDRLSTANFVASNPSPRKHSADMISSSNRTLATPSPRPMLSKIPVPGSLQK